MVVDLSLQELINDDYIDNDNKRRSSNGNRMLHNFHVLGVSYVYVVFPI